MKGKIGEDPNKKNNYPLHADLIGANYNHKLRNM
jgi:hypothetical protein